MFLPKSPCRLIEYDKHRCPTLFPHILYVFLLSGLHYSLFPLTKRIVLSTYFSSGFFGLQLCKSKIRRKIISIKYYGNILNIYFYKCTLPHQVCTVMEKDELAKWEPSLINPAGCSEPNNKISAFFHSTCCMQWCIVSAMPNNQPRLMWQTH